MDPNPTSNNLFMSLFLEFHSVNEETSFILWKNSQSVLILSQYDLEVKKIDLGIRKAQDTVLTPLLSILCLEKL